ncbi:MAG: DUF6619 domain-containing protein [Sarcina sp.]
MIKHSVRLAAFILAFFTFLLMCQNIMLKQQRLPFDTNQQFELNTSNSEAAKEELINDLNKITNKNNGTLIKVVADIEFYENKKDIIWFGTNQPTSKNIIIENGKIQWFSSKFNGELISSNNMRVEPLYGKYSMDENEAFKNDLIKWANENNIIINWINKSSIIKEVYYNLVHNSMGNAIITAFLLFLTTLVGWFISKAKGRTIRLVGGVSTKRIHLEDIVSIAKISSCGFLIAWIVLLVYISFMYGVKQIPLVMVQSFIVLILLLVLLVFITAIISIIVKPKTEHLAMRTIPLRKFKLIGSVIGSVTIILSILIIPGTINSAYISKELSKEYSLWNKITNSVSLSFGDINSLETEKMLPNVEDFFSDMDKQNNLYLSLVIDKSISLTKEELGDYDHIVIANKAWVETFDIGIDKERGGGSLNEIFLKDIQKSLNDFFSAQIPLWTKSNEIQPNGLGFYEFKGKAFLALSPNIGYGGSTIQAKNPLIILVDDATEILKTKGFLLYAASSGNVLFPNHELLQSTVYKSPIKEYVISIDTIAGTALEQSQKFAKEFMIYIIACILIFTSMIFAGILNAHLWVGVNKKRIFTLHTCGKKFNVIIYPSLRKNLLIVGLTSVIGGIIALILKRPNPIILLIVGISIVLLYSIGNFFTYKICTKKIFYKMSCRND